MNYLWLLIGTFFLKYLNEDGTPLEHKQKNDIVIEISVGAGQTLLFNYWDDENMIQKLEFRNPSKNDSIISKLLALKKYTHFTRGVITKSLVTKKYVTTIDNFLLLAGDTLKLKSDGNSLQKLYYSGGAAQLDEIFWMPSTFDFEFEQYEEYKRNGFSIGFDPHKNNTLQRISDSSKQSMALIKRLYSQQLLSNNYYDALQRFNLLNTYNSIAVYSTIYSGLTDTYKEMYNQIDGWGGIASRMNNNVLDFVFKQLSIKDSGGKWDAFISLADTMKSKPQIVHYLLYKIKSDKVTRNKDSLKHQLNTFAKAGFPNQLFTNYYSEYLRSESLKSSTEASLVTLQGDSVTLRSKMALLKGRYVFVDIWASWCAPCFGQMPYLQKVKEELKNENIAFLSLSADNEEQHAAWLAAAKKESLDNGELDFRFRKGFKNTYLEVNKITSIPRYMLFNTNGEVIDSDFIQPSNPKFKGQLLSYLKK